jgi:hypothetical protein
MPAKNSPHGPKNGQTTGEVARLILMSLPGKIGWHCLGFNVIYRSALGFERSDIFELWITFRMLLE